jgi:hypothetical protein
MRWQMISTQDARTDLAQAFQTLDEVTNLARSGKATAQAVADAEDAVRLARLRVEGVEIEERQARIDADHRAAAALADQWRAVLLAHTEEHLAAIDAAEAALARVATSGEALAEATAQTGADLRTIKHLPAGISRVLDRSGLLIGVEIGGKVWPVNRELTAQALIEPLARVRHLLDRQGAAWRRLSSVWHLSGERGEPEAPKYPTDALRAAVRGAA